MDKKYIPNQDAINRTIKSIEHWEADIVHRLELGETIRQGNDSRLHWKDNSKHVKCTEEFCSLCTYYAGNGCERCPIVLRHNVSCNSPNSPWFAFMRDPRLATAESMVKSLREVLIPPGEGEIYELVKKWVGVEMAAGKLSTLDLEDLCLAMILQKTADRAVGLEEYVATLVTRVEELERSRLRYM